MSGNKGARTYARRDCAVFRKTDEAFGGLSNMAPGYPVRVNGVRVMTIEALYQASRFPHLPDVQRLIIDQHSPMTAKMVSKPHRKDSRADWDKVRITVMRWCLRLKLSQHWSKFSQLLLSTGDRAVVEDSKKDDFWGAIPSNGDTLVGLNVLGRLLMELREEIKKGAELRRVEAPAIENFLLFGEPLQVVDFRADKNAPAAETKYAADDALDELALPLFSTPASKDKSSEPAAVSAISAKPSGGLIDGVKPYPEYSDSMQLWLGKIPAHWSLLPNRALFDEVKDRNHPNEEMLSVTITRGIIHQKALLTDSSKKDSSNVNKGAYKLVQPGDIAYNKMRAWQGAVGASSFRGIISPAYVVMRPRKDCTPWYYHHLYRTPSFAKEAERWSYGITSDMWSLRPEHFKVIYSLQPPLDEQAAVVRFLEHASRKIDGFIRAKRKLIGLLNEQKQAIVHRAVTRGIDHRAPLRPSGVPWLSDIPKHWEVRRAKYLFREVDERSKSGGEELLSVSHITGVTPRSQKNVTMFKAESNVGYKICRVGDLAINTMWAWMAALGVSKHEGIISPAYAVYRQRKPERLVGDYADMLLRTTTYKANYIVRSTGVRASRLRLYPEQFFRIPILLPPAEEQEAIVAFVKGETASLNNAIARTEREIALMQEYRTRLTADVVTGKLDVRAAAAHLPALTPESISATDAPDETETEETDA